MWDRQLPRSSETYHLLRPFALYSIQSLSLVVSVGAFSDVYRPTMIPCCRPLTPLRWNRCRSRRWRCPGTASPCPTAPGGTPGSPAPDRRGASRSGSPSRGWPWRSGRWARPAGGTRWAPVASLALVAVAQGDHGVEVHQPRAHGPVGVAGGGLVQGGQLRLAGGLAQHPVAGGRTVAGRVPGQLHPVGVGR